MKIAFCLYKYFPFGGLQRDFLRIARECRDRGHEVHVFTMTWTGEQEPGFNVHIIQATALTNHGRSRYFIDQLQDMLEDETFDLVVGFNKMPGLDLYYAADVCYKGRVANRSWLYKALPRYREWVRQEKAVFACGKHTQIMLIAPTQQAAFATYYHTEPERFHLLPPGIAKDRVAPANADEIRAQVRTQWEIGDAERLIIMIGSGFKTKGVDRAIDAFVSLPEVLREHSYLFVIGADDPDPYMQVVQRHRLEKRVRFLGGRNDVPSFLLAADVLMHPAYYDNTATALLEAVVAGLPVLTTDQCGYAHYVNQAQAGIVLPAPFEQAKLNQSLAEMLLDDERRLTWHDNALKFAKQADIYSMPQRAADLIEKVGLKRAALSTS